MGEGGVATAQKPAGLTPQVFTGIITAIGIVREVSALGSNHDLRLRIQTPPAFLAAQGGTATGASIACSGCCLTAVALGEDWFAVDVSRESLGLTTIGAWTPGTSTNLERSLRLGDELGGHLVSGHVDGLGEIVSITPEGGSQRYTIQVKPPLHRFMAQKGSVSIDGVSLTVNEVSDSEGGVAKFGVNLIPHTAANTTLGLRRPGDAVHIEIDMLARYVARLTETQ